MLVCILSIACTFVSKSELADRLAALEGGDSSPPDTSRTPGLDLDEDGFAVPVDCWDDPATLPDDLVALNDLPQLAAGQVYPGAEDVPYDGVDADCAGDGDFDADGDGSDTMYALDREGASGPDCYDMEGDPFDNPAGLAPADTYPDAEDTAYDGTDQDCAGDDDWDRDADGYPCAAAPDADGACPGDCDDDDPTRYPSEALAETWYDGIDANCDGRSDYDQDLDGEDAEGYGGTDCADDDDTIGSTAEEIWYDGVDQDCDAADDYDADGDGYASASHADGAGQLGADCYDDVSDTFSDPAGLGPAAVNPGAVDTWYDGTDQDCDGASEYDQDGDGEDAEAYGGTDCDDRDTAVFLGAIEDCTTSGDDNCDGALDEQDAAGCSLWYVDDDGDGYGDAVDAECWCEVQPGSGHTAASGDDCDDLAAEINPDAAERCDALDVDEDCDGLAEDDDPTATGGGTWYPDVDGDGQGGRDEAGVLACEAPTDHVMTQDDCDDTDPAVYDGAQEVCDPADTDEDCDGLADDADPSVDSAGGTAWFADADGDGFGGVSAVTGCDAPSDTTTDASDCDDTDAAVHPGAPELCDTADVDEDCDGLAEDADADSTGKSVYYVDGDGDGQGAGAVVEWCDAPSGYVATDEDCDDMLAEVYLGGLERCSTAYDDDCDGQTTDPEAVDVLAWYADADGDGYGDVGTTQTACAQPSGYVTDYTDCDDASASAYPGATELCNARDDDCDGSADESTAVDAGTWYYDQDSDGYGHPTDTTVACLAPTGYAARGEDCDDTRSAVNPAASERCSTAYDDDCDGEINEEGASGALTWYADSDGDSYGDGASTSLACTQPSGYVANDDDCEDADASAYPGAVEQCTTDYDDDCDGQINESGAVGLAYYYTDADGDGYGDSADTSATPGCALIPGQASNTEDCDDTNDAVNPDAEELCSTAYDDDCDGVANETGASGATLFYVDVDGDGYGASTDAGTLYCATSVIGRVTDHTDCNDGNAAISPGDPERCSTSGVDDDCDGSADEDGASGAVTYYDDDDGDAYGDPTDTRTACAQPSGYTTNDDDCDDTRSTVSPADAEVCDTSNVDEDCDGLADDQDTVATGRSTWYLDADSDTYGTASTTLARCDQPAGYVSNDDDCNDTTNTVSPADSEACDASNVDEDCDGLADDLDSGATGRSTWYRDFDADTYGTANTTLARCDQPSGYVSNDDDCNDGTSAVSPADVEVCDASNVDEDCDGTADDLDTAATGTSVWYQDVDTDTYGTPNTSLARCDQPSGYVSNDDDCDDTNNAISPIAQELCANDTVDNDCDGVTTDVDGSASDRTTWYVDADGDGDGDETDAGVFTCEAPAGHANSNGDCDDTDAWTYSGAPVYCDDVDNDCDATVESEAGVVTGIDAAGDPVVINGYSTAGSLVTTWGTSSSSSTDYTVPSTLDSINVCAGDYYVNLTVAASTTPIVLTIDGIDGYASTTLWGTNGGSSILHVIATTSNHEITVDNLTFADGDGYLVNSSKRAGGAVMVAASSNPTVPNVALNNCELVDSVIGGGSVLGYGGAIAVGYPSTSGRYGRVRLEGTTVTGNGAACGGAVYINRGELEADCTGSTAGFTLNDATSGLGGAFEFESTNYGSVDVTACEMGSASTADDNSSFDIALSVAFQNYEGVSTFYCDTLGTAPDTLQCTP